jgi:hypothetical protein
VLAPAHAFDDLVTELRLLAKERNERCVERCAALLLDEFTDRRRGQICGLAGSSPIERSSGQSHAPGGIHRRGRKPLRLLASQAALCLVLNHLNFRQRFLALTQRWHRRPEKRQVYMAVAKSSCASPWAMATAGHACDGQVVLGLTRSEVRVA